MALFPGGRPFLSAFRDRKTAVMSFLRRAGDPGPDGR